MDQQIKAHRKKHIQKIYLQHPELVYLLEGVNEELNNLIGVVEGNIQGNDMSEEGKSLLKWIKGMESVSLLNYLVKYESDFVINQDN